MGINTSRLCDRRAYRGRIDGEYRMRAPSVASRSRTRGWRTATGPMPVMISRSGRWPWRTTRCWPVSVLRSVCFARNSATSASTAWVSNARAPLRRISVRESVKAPGWASLMTLLSDTAYHSFIGEVEALNTTTIRRLTRSRRHQLLAIAPQARGDRMRKAQSWRGDGPGFRETNDKDEDTNLTASVIGNFAGFSDWRIATRASREGPGEGDDKTSADGCDRVRHMPFGADRRRLGVGNRREGQIPRRAGCKAVLRGEGRRVRRSGSRRRRYRVWRGGESRATHALRNRQSRAPA